MKMWKRILALMLVLLFAMNSMGMADISVLASDAPAVATAEQAQEGLGPDGDSGQDGVTSDPATSDPAPAEPTDDDTSNNDDGTEAGGEPGSDIVVSEDDEVLPEQPEGAPQDGEDGGDGSEEKVDNIQSGDSAEDPADEGEDGDGEPTGDEPQGGEPAEDGEGEDQPAGDEPQGGPGAEEQPGIEDGPSADPIANGEPDAIIEVGETATLYSEHHDVGNHLWTSSEDAIATVKGGTGIDWSGMTVYGEVTGIAPGTVTITHRYRTINGVQTEKFIVEVRAKSEQPSGSRRVYLYLKVDGEGASRYEENNYGYFTVGFIDVPASCFNGIDLTKLPHIQRYGWSTDKDVSYKEYMAAVVEYVNSNTDKIKRYEKNASLLLQYENITWTDLKWCYNATDYTDPGTAEDNCWHLDGEMTLKRSFKVTIEYQYGETDEEHKQGSQAATPYERNVSAGTNLNVTSPTVEGYVPDTPVVTGKPTSDYHTTVYYYKDSNGNSIPDKDEKGTVTYVWDEEVKDVLAGQTLPQDTKNYIEDEEVTVDPEHKYNKGYVVEVGDDEHGNPTEQYTFRGWFLGDDDVTGTTVKMGEDGLTFTGKWEKGEIPYEKYHHTVKYEWAGDAPAGATLPGEKTYARHQMYDIEPVPTAADYTVTDDNGNVLEQYTFDGWKDDSGKIVSGKQTMDENDVVYHGTWTKTVDKTEEDFQVTIKYEADEGGSVDKTEGETLTMKDGMVTASATATPDDENGYEFAYWTWQDNGSSMGRISGQDESLSYLFAATGRHTYTFTAHFKLKTYKVEVQYFYDNEKGNAPIGAETELTVTHSNTANLNNEPAKTVTVNGTHYALDDVVGNGDVITGPGQVIKVYYATDEKGTDPETGETGDGVPDKYQVTVTFEVENGYWNKPEDGEDNTPQTVVLTREKVDGKWSMDTAAKLQASDIPEVGENPITGYKAGAWHQGEDGEPFEEFADATEITEDTVFTYEYMKDSFPLTVKYLNADGTVLSNSPEAKHVLFEDSYAVGIESELSRVAARVAKENKVEVPERIGNLVLDHYMIVEGIRFGTMTEKGVTIYVYYEVDSTGGTTGEPNGVPDKDEANVTYTIVYGTFTDTESTLKYEHVVFGSRAEDGTWVSATSAKLEHVPGTDKMKPIEGYKLNGEEGWQGGAAPTTATKDEENVFTYTCVKDSFQYTVNFYYDGERDTEESKTGNLEFEQTIPYDAPDGKDHGDQHYTLDRVEKKSDGIITAVEDNNVVDVYYALDADNDGKPDKYQVKVTYKVVNGTWSDGKTDDKTEDVLLAHEEGGNWVEYDHVTLNPPTGMQPNTGYTGGTWGENNPTGYEVKKDGPNELVFTYTFTEGTYNYTVYYHYDAAVVTEGPTAGTFGDTIPYNADSPKEYNGKNYILESVDKEGATITAVDDNNVVNVYYTLDAIGTDPENPDKPDGVADKYQVTLVYVADPEGAGTVSKTKEVLTIGDKAENGTVSVEAVATATTGSGYAFDYWELPGNNKLAPNEQLKEDAYAVDGGETYTFTAHFAEDKIGKDGPDGVPDRYQVTVTYKIENGTWSEGGAEDKTEVVTLVDEGNNWSEEGSGELHAPTGMTPDDGYDKDKGSWTPELPEAVKKGDNTTYEYSYQKGEYGYTVNYHYDDVVETEGPKSGTFGDKIPYDTTSPKEHDGKNYILENVTNENGTITSNESGNVVDVFYVLDEIGNGPDGPDKPDGTADKYQAKVTYTVQNGTFGGDGTERSEVVTLYDEDGKTPSEYGTGHLQAIPEDMQPDTGYDAEKGAWGDDKPTKEADFTVNSPRLYTYTYPKASFTITVKYVDEDGNAIQDATVTTHEFESAYSVDIDEEITTASGDHYIKVSVTDEETLSAEKMPATDLTFTAKYALDNMGTSEEREKGDGVADKYQVTIKYAHGENGTVEQTEEVITLQDEETGEYLTEGDVTATATATADGGYHFDSWTADNGIEIDAEKNAEGLDFTFHAEGGKTYTFTASFGRDIPGPGVDPVVPGPEGPDPDPDPDPDNPENPDPENPDPENPDPDDPDPDDPDDPPTPPAPVNPNQPGGPDDPDTPDDPGDGPNDPGDGDEPDGPTDPADGDEANGPQDEADIDDNAVPLANLPQTAEKPGYEVKEEADIAENDTPLGLLDDIQNCCILHFLIMLCALAVTVYYTHDRKRRQEREFEVRSELGR